jgi:ferredoxin--NADP+ reductase
VIKAIGCRGRAVDGLPFDELTGTLCHRAGSVYDPDAGETVVGVYCSGWIKRGATGIIGTNKVDSEQTVDAILHDLGAGRLIEPVHDHDHLDRLVRARRPEVVDKDGWARIDQAERSAGRPARRPRRKLVSVAELPAASRPDGR